MARLIADPPTARAAEVDLTEAHAPSAREGALAVGLVATAVACLAMMAVLGEVIPPVVVFVLVLIGLAVGVRRSPARWLRWAAAAVPLLLVVANAPFAIPDLSHPESPGGFIPTVLVVGCALATVVAGVAAAIRRPLRATPLWGGAAALMALGIAGSLAMGAGVTDDVAEAGDGQVVATQFTYPDRVALPADATGVTITNEDVFRHTFVIEGTDVAIELPGSTVRRVPLDLPPGTYRYLCDVPGHTGMEGVIEVG